MCASWAPCACIVPFALAQMGYASVERKKHLLELSDHLKKTLGDPNRWDCSHKSLLEAGEKIPVINYTKQYVLLELFVVMEGGSCVWAWSLYGAGKKRGGMRHYICRSRDPLFAPAASAYRCIHAHVVCTWSLSAPVSLFPISSPVFSLRGTFDITLLSMSTYLSKFVGGHSLRHDSIEIPGQYKGG